jgi:hypothetical protein
LSASTFATRTDPRQAIRLSRTGQEKPMRRRLLIGIGLILWIGLVVFVMTTRFDFRLDPPPPPGVNVETFKHLYVGMTLPELEERLGGPGKYDRSAGNEYSWLVWTGPDCKMRVRFGNCFGSPGDCLAFAELITNDGHVFTVP